MSSACGDEIVIEQLEEFGRKPGRGWLCVRIQDMNDDMSGALGLASTTARCPRRCPKAGDGSRHGSPAM